MPQVAGRDIIRAKSIGAGMNLLMSPLMPWQRQMGAFSTSDLKLSQQILGGAGSSALVRYSMHGISCISDDRHSVITCGVVDVASALWEFMGICAPGDPRVIGIDGSGVNGRSPGIWIVGSCGNGGSPGIWIVGRGGSGGSPGNPTRDVDGWLTSAMAFTAGCCCCCCSRCTTSTATVGLNTWESLAAADGGSEAATAKRAKTTTRMLLEGAICMKRGSGGFSCVLVDVRYCWTTTGLFI